ncbi:MAG: hypothetical protein H6815_05550 [Phycisphaeraceae bacterium]|nr:hypothetical protein [Phycisphaerales bacterium]MCB9859903.1 hypothetical protein [Phycisphaeraceae bacterium]
MHTQQPRRAGACVASRVLAAGVAFTVPAIAFAQTGTSSVPVSSYDELFGDAALREIAERNNTLSGVEFGGVMQFRYLSIYRGDQFINDELTTGFQNSRTLVWFGGDLGEEFRVYVQGGFDHFDPGEFGLNDAYLTYQYNERVQFGAGQRRSPLLQQDIVEPWNQQAIEVSSAHLFLSPIEVQGVWVYAEQDATRGWLMLHDGVGSGNTDIDSADEADVALVARGEYKWAGAWDQFDQFTSPMDAEEAGRVGAAFGFQTGGSTVGSQDIDALYFIFDAMYQGSGWNLFGQVAVATIDQTNASDLVEFTAEFQAGMYLSQSTEIFGRFDSIFPDDARPNHDPTTILTFGINEYLIPDDPQALKLSFDVQWLFQDPVGSGTPGSTLTGVLPSVDAGEVVFKGQIQARY